MYGGLLAVVCGAGLAWRLRHPLPDAGETLDRGDNGLWMRRHWLHGGASIPPGELAVDLRALGIRRLYPFLGPMDAEGWPGWRDEGRIQRYDPAVAGAFLRDLEAADPDLLVLPWSGGVYRRDVVLGDEARLAGFAGHAADLVALGADGIHLNVEPMPDGTAGFLDLLRRVKAAIGPDAVLSVAAYPPTTRLHPSPDVHWSLAYTRAVCLEADELVVMAYDTALGVQIVYEGLVAGWTRDLARTLPPPSEGGCTWSMGVPAYEDDEPWHRPDVETLDVGIRGVSRGLAGLDAVPASFTGVTIYASWTTDAAEWATYERDWRRVAPTGRRVVEVAGE